MLLWSLHGVQGPENGESAAASYCVGAQGPKLSKAPEDYDSSVTKGVSHTQRWMDILEGPNPGKMLSVIYSAKKKKHCLFQLAQGDRKLVG